MRSSSSCARSSCRRSRATRKRSPPRPRARAGPSASTSSTLQSSRSRSAASAVSTAPCVTPTCHRRKRLATLDRARLPNKVTKQLPALCDGGFVERGDNLLVFGLPGRGKTHVVAAIGHELVRRGYRVLFTPTFALVQRLLAAKRDLRLERELVSLDTYPL
ncbi:MAG TPA: ATP-binding protein [Acidothermaceae bacterium]